MAQRNSEWMFLISIGPHFGICTVIGWLIGNKWVDPWLGTAPVFAIVLGLLGIAAGFVNLFRELARLNKKQEEEDNDEQS